MKKKRKERIAHNVDDNHIREVIDTKACCLEEDKDTLFTMACRINEEMTEHNISQEALCEKLGISQGALSNYRNGLRFPDSNVLAKMANEFNTTTDYLLGLTSLKSIDKDYQKVHALTGLSDNAIKVLENLLSMHKENLSFNSNNTAINDMIDTISYLIEKEEKHFLFSNLATYLWFDAKNEDLVKTKQTIKDDDYHYQYTVDMISTIAKIKLDKTLIEIKQEIEKNTK